jgi:hypothetical protein
VLDIAVGSKGLGRVSTVDDLSTTLRRAADNLDDVRHRLGDGRVGQTSKVNYRLLTDGGRGLGDLDVRFPTAGKNAKAITQFEQIRHLDELAPDEQTALLRQLGDAADSRATRQFLNDLDDVDDVRFLLDEDVPTLNRLTRWYTNPDAHRHIDPDLSADDLVHVARNGDVSETQLVVKGPDGNTRWLQEGQYAPDSPNTVSSGWEYLEQRHIEGDQIYEKSATDFWPVGQTVKSKSLPRKMTNQDIRDAIYTAVKNTKTDSQDAFNYADFSTEFVEETGVSSIRVIIRNGKVRTAWPKDGDSVWKYISEGDVGWVEP